MTNTYTLNFETWSSENEVALTTLFAETGSDREMDFDLEASELEVFNTSNRQAPMYRGIVWEIDLTTTTSIEELEKMIVNMPEYIVLIINEQGIILNETSPDGTDYFAVVSIEDIDEARELINK